MTYEEAKAKAHRVITLRSLDEIPQHFRNMLAFHVTAHLKHRGDRFYAYREIAADGSEQNVFVELAL